MVVRARGVESILCLGVLAPVVWFETGGLPPFDVTYFWMMIAPVIAVAVAPTGGI